MSLILSNILKLCLITLVMGKDEFMEELFIKPLPPVNLYTHFQFITTLDSESSFQHTQLLPRALSEVISRFEVEELHLSLTQGQWKHRFWGYPVLDAAPGVELYTWFSSQVQDVDTQWKQLTQTLSGLVCASLNFIHSHNTITPQMSLQPSGLLSSGLNHTSQLRYASLPRETICTENLTPWKKLLPCDSVSGLSQLLNSRMIHNTNYHSLSIHFRKLCSNNDCSATNYEIKLNVALVYDYNMMKSPHWSIRKLFGQGLPGACPLASSSLIYVDVSSNSSQKFTLQPAPATILKTERGGSDVELAIYNITGVKEMTNIAANIDDGKTVFVPTPPPLYFNRYILGYGKEFGGIVTEISNTYWAPIDIVVMENLPWWLPIQLSSLRVNGKSDSNIILSKYFSPGWSRQKPYHLELLMKLPPRSTTTLTIDFEFTIMKWQEYPPDANQGFYIGSSLILANLPTAKNYTSLPLHGSSFSSLINASQPWYPAVLRTNGAMVSLPTPDFSMPYNVICLVCTVVALAFGPLHNICTKTVMLAPSSSSLTFKQKLLKIFKFKKD